MNLKPPMQNQLIHDDPRAQAPASRWAWLTLTIALWCALIGALVPSALDMAYSLADWMLSLEKRDWIVFIASAGLVALGIRATRRRDHTSRPAPQSKLNLAGLYDTAEVDAIRSARRVVAHHDQHGQLASVEVFKTPEPATAVKTPRKAANRATNRAANRAINEAANEAASEAAIKAPIKQATKQADKPVPKPRLKPVQKRARPAAVPSTGSDEGTTTAPSATAIHAGANTSSANTSSANTSNADTSNTSTSAPRTKVSPAVATKKSSNTASNEASTEAAQAEWSLERVKALLSKYQRPVEASKPAATPAAATPAAATPAAVTSAAIPAPTVAIIPAITTHTTSARYATRTRGDGHLPLRVKSIRQAVDRDLATQDEPLSASAPNEGSGIAVGPGMIMIQAPATLPWTSRSKAPVRRPVKYMLLASALSLLLSFESAAAPGLSPPVRQDQAEAIKAPVTRPPKARDPPFW